MFDVDKPKLSFASVAAIFKGCKYDTYSDDKANSVVCSGPSIKDVRFDRDRLAEHDSIIVEFLSCVVESGDASTEKLIPLREMSFISGGRRWADIDVYAEQLLTLGMALGRVRKVPAETDSFLESPVYAINLS